MTLSIEPTTLIEITLNRSFRNVLILELTNSGIKYSAACIGISAAEQSVPISMTKIIIEPVPVCLAKLEAFPLYLFPFRDSHGNIKKQWIVGRTFWRAGMPTPTKVTGTIARLLTV